MQDQTIKWAIPKPITYGEKLTRKQLNAQLTVGDGALTYDPPLGRVLDAGRHELSVTAAATKEYNKATATVALQVRKASQVLEWAAPEPITYGERLGGTQLDAKLEIGDGKLAYLPKSGSLLDAGRRRLKVTARETDNFEEASTTVQLVVRKAAQVITWKKPDAITYGERLGNKQLAAKLETGDGDLTYDPKKGARLAAGSRTLSVTASETRNYERTSEQVTLVVDRAVQVIEWNPAPIVAGRPLGAAQCNAVVRIGDGALRYQHAAGTAAPKEWKEYAIGVEAGETANYLTTRRTAQLEVRKPGPIEVSRWMRHLGFDKKTNLYMKDLGAYGAGDLSQRQKSVHVSIFKSQLPPSLDFASRPQTVLDTLFPDNGNRGFHITLEINTGGGLGNPHVYRGLDEIYKGQGINLTAKEWAQMKKRLTKKLDAAVAALAQAIAKTDRFSLIPG